MCLSTYVLSLFLSLSSYLLYSWFLYSNFKSISAKWSILFLYKDFFYISIKIDLIPSCIVFRSLVKFLKFFKCVRILISSSSPVFSVYKTLFFLLHSCVVCLLFCVYSSIVCRFFGAFFPSSITSFNFTCICVTIPFISSLFPDNPYLHFCCGYGSVLSVSYTHL